MIHDGNRIPAKNRATVPEFIQPLTKREAFAMAAMQGMCGNSNQQVCNTSFEDMTRAAVAMADLLLKALEADNA